MQAPCVWRSTYCLAKTPGTANSLDLRSTSRRAKFVVVSSRRIDSRCDSDQKIVLPAAEDRFSPNRRLNPGSGNQQNLWTRISEDPEDLAIPMQRVPAHSCVYAAQEAVRKIEIGR